MSTTLLDIVQNVMSSMDSDEVNSINDNTESLQVAYVVRDSYNDIISRLELPADFQLFELTASGDPAKPTLMTLPDVMKSMEWVKYNYCDTSLGDTSPRFTTVKFVSVDDFLTKMSYLNTDTMDNVESFSHTVAGFGTFEFLYYNDRFPTTFTTWDDYTYIFDGYKADVDTTLQASKTQAYGERSRTFTLTDAFEIPLSDRLITLLTNEAKTQAFAELKQAVNANAERRARRGWISEQHLKKKTRTHGYREMSLPDYGRK